MEGSPFLPLPEGMIIDQVQMTEAQLTVIVISTQPSAPCPGCGCPSEHVHSQYQRTVNDVPCAGRNVVLRLCVRKFFCLQLCCPRKVFAERLPELVRPWARVSNRLLEELKAVGLAASAEVSERLAPRLGMKVKAPTLLRYLRTIPDLPKTNVTVLGIDDFAMRRGDKYGTILINIETSKPASALAGSHRRSGHALALHASRNPGGQPGSGQCLCGCSEPGLASCDSGCRSLPSYPKSAGPSPTVPGSQAHLFTRGCGYPAQRRVHQHPGPQRFSC